MNNRERAQQIADEHGNDAFNVALAMLDEQNKIKAIIQTDTDDSEWKSIRYAVSSVGGETDYAELSKAHILEREKLKRQRDASDVDINKIKAEAVREALDDYTGFFLEISDADNKEYNRGVDDALYQFRVHLESYINQLENKND